ncbi:DUF4396 domain-containing protein [Halobacterium noricense]|uniref:DUF4396 domain-containing protein n=1 Tax=Halobacterium noricense TaxID=223182 RepID=UPI001E5B1BAF|nr:DUF4396 domain-containing protein [Halobacterium noricense]UHH26731.1 DUF4396 domain-containing protein [Halobacterium noricense]
MSVASLLHSIEEALAPAREVVRPVVSDHRVLAAWAVLVAASVGVLWWDLRRNNEAIPSLMRAVWSLVVVYSGPAGLALYWYAGRTQISQDSLWRRGVRSTAHCYSGCGAGEVTGVVLLVGVLAIGNSLVTTLGTFAFAYTFGYALTVGPLLQDGETLTTALADALYTETPSITVMEVTAIGTDLLLAGGATIGEPLFWGALAFSLSVGFVAAFPVNVALLRVGVKEGMANPAELAGSGA